MNDDGYAITSESHVKLKSIGTLCDSIPHSVEGVDESLAFGATMSNN